MIGVVSFPAISNTMFVDRNIFAPYQAPPAQPDESSVVPIIDVPPFVLPVVAVFVEGQVFPFIIVVVGLT